jgi:primosomal protein N' (replication factor Y) (superfamily II helicase)
MEEQTQFVDVIVPLAVPNRYTYRVPQAMNGGLTRGKRVIVQFGKSKLYTGIVYRLHHQAPRHYTAKYVEAILDEEPVVTELQLKFWDWLAFYYCANPGDVMNAALPSGLKLQSDSVISLHPDFNPEEAEAGLFSEKESRVISALLNGEALTFSDLSQMLDVKAPQALVSRLYKKKAVVVYEDLGEKFRPRLETFYRLREGLTDVDLHTWLDRLEKKAFRQAEALLYVLQLVKTGNGEVEWINKSQLLKKVEGPALKSLVKKELLEEREFETGRLHFEKRGGKLKPLGAQQETACAAIRAAFLEKKPVLLHGVTGSGKTEVYISLIGDMLAQGREVLLLIPEIALTTQLITRLRAAFGEVVGVYHSRFSENERVEIWNNVLSAPEGGKKYKVILGARSALFLPYHRLGLVIIDEEHDSSFKQHDPSPRYHARDAALFLASLHGANVLLGSATPSMESFYNVKTGKYSLAEIRSQYVSGGGTHVEVADTLYYTNSNQMRASLTPPLYEAVSRALMAREQVILFQNRRGFAPYTECRKCGHVPHCVQCDVSLIYHKQQQKLVCHYCGYNINPPSTCSACGSNQLHYKGFGTEKIEEDIEILFPSAKIARMDLDSTRSKYAYRQLIDDFESGNIDILIGTQMVTKGLDFTNVSLVGVLNADSILNFPDFRSFERAYQLLTQVRGRAGRSNKMGRVIIQTSQPEHEVIRHVIRGSYAEFMEQTLTERKAFGYPPFSRLFVIRVASKDLNEVNHLAQELFVLLDQHFHGQLLGPEFPMVSRIRNEYLKHILLKAPRTDSAGTIRQHISDSLDALQQKHRSWRYRTVIDVDPA